MAPAGPRAASRKYPNNPNKLSPEPTSPHLLESARACVSHRGAHACARAKRARSLHAGPHGVQNEHTARRAERHTVALARWL